MLFIAITLLMMQLQSFSLLFLVLSVVPMGLIGVVAALLIFNKPLGFVAILGILSLLGMIARNGVILIDQIETVRAQGVAIWNAVIEAAIHVTRLHMLPRAFIEGELARLQVIVDKTAGPAEHEAMALLTEHVRRAPQHVVHP